MSDMLNDPVFFNLTPDDYRRAGKLAKMHNQLEEQWPQDSGEEQWQQETIHFLTLMRQMEIFEPVCGLTHRRQANRRSASVAELGPQPRMVSVPSWQQPDRKHRVRSTTLDV
ncbi:uncharacterized protein FFNC_15174 [Fusarium fujikuroi]|nr:uncharacterized protein FFNC_15174 [Fusarium fujikuroi]